MFYRRGQHYASTTIAVCRGHMVAMILHKYAAADSSVISIRTREHDVDLVR